ncbi:MAG: caspase family protein [Anaeromyxobacter sp.]
MVLREALAAALAAAVLALPGAAGAEPARYAVVAGNDAGLPPDAPLRWAEADAERVAAALSEVGGVPSENVVLLRGQDAGAFRRALIAVNERVRLAGREAVLFVYYSGHADAEALHLGATALQLGELEQLVRGSAATFRLLVLDACRSGALTRVKGGRPIPPFELRASERAPGEGAVFLTSSSASEDSQESDELRGSFFTHAFLSGLLGAADEDGDGRVTLEEVYRHAYAATLRNTSRTWAGTQHPTFQYDVRGQGDLVLATLPSTGGGRGWLALPDGLDWLVFRDSADGPVVGEVARADRARRLSVKPGTYFVRGRGADVLLEGELAAAAGGTATPDPARLRRTAYARLVRKGLSDLGLSGSVELEGRTRVALASEGRTCSGAAAGVAVALRPLTLVARLGWCRSGFEQGPLHATTEGFDLEVGAARVWDVGAGTVELGLLAGSAVLQQRFRTPGVAPSRTSAALQLAPVLSASRELGARTYVYASLSGATYLFRLEDGERRSARFAPSFAPRGALGLGVRW